MQTNFIDAESSVGFLFSDVSRLMRAWFDVHARELGLTRSQWRVLVNLAPREGVNQRALAEILELDVVTLSRHVDRLEAAGMVERRRDPDDRRAWRLHLGEGSRPLLPRMRALAEQTQDAALAGLSAEERERLVAMLLRIKANVSPEARTTAAAAGEAPRGAPAPRAAE